jgi:GT2 family glycosyltransferase
MLQTYARFEIIVIENASEDNSMKILRTYEEISIIENAKNLGFASAVNQGITEAVGEYILLLNNDVVIENDFLDKIIEPIKNNPRIFSVASKMIRFYEKNLLDDAGDFYNLLGWAFKRGDGKPITKYNKNQKIFSACAGASIYRKSVFKEIGLFDDDFFAYLEDVDIAYRGKIHGYINIYEPDAVCYHIGSATSGGTKYNSFKIKLSARNNLYVCYKNMPLLQLIINLPFLTMGFLIKYIFFTGKGFREDYLDGFSAGINGIKQKSVKKIDFKLENTINYFKIQFELIINTFYYIIIKYI